jgi:repressor of nif and glnA expression
MMNKLAKDYLCGDLDIMDVAIVLEAKASWCVSARSTAEFLNAQGFKTTVKKVKAHIDCLVEKGVLRMCEDGEYELRGEE